MGGDIPATLIRVSYLLDSGENVKSMHACGLADDVVSGILVFLIQISNPDTRF